MDIIDPIFNMHKIKFNILDKWNIVNRSTDRAIVYINLDNVFKFIMTSRVNNFIQASVSTKGDDALNNFKLSIVSNIINLGQHYRLWLAKQCIESRIILYWNCPIGGSNEYKNRKYIATYRSDYNSKYQLNMDNTFLIDILNNSIPFCVDCIKYVNEIYLVNGNNVEASLVPYLLNDIYSKDNVKTKNIVISNSIYDFIYTKYGFDVLSPSVGKGDPYRVTKDNVIEVLKNKFKVKTVMSVDSSFIEFIVALLGDHDRNVPTITGVGVSTIIKMLSVALQNSLISPNVSNINMLSDILKSDYKDIFQKNYHCVSFEYQMNDVEPLDIHMIKSQLVDNFDDTTLKEMNEKYFKLCPIEIISPKSEQVLYDRNPYSDSLFSIH